MATETLRVRNFAGLNDVQLELKPVTVLIGPQASGKSVCAKLAFFFKEAVRRLPAYILSESSHTEIQEEEQRLFLSYFPPESWSTGWFEITYSFGELVITARRTTSEPSAFELEYAPYYDYLLDAGRTAIEQIHKDEDPPLFDIFGLRAVRHAIEEQVSVDVSPVLANSSYFIPAGRSFFATVRSSVFSLISEQTEIDPFLVEFGRLYERVRKRYPPSGNRSEVPLIMSRIETLLGGRYLREQGDDFIQMPDGRRIPLAVSSSGQQELLPLAITLASIGEGNGDKPRSTLYVEEPEAHLFPTAQRQIVHLFAAVTDLLSPESSSQYIITTHSPYILAALNNLMYGGKIAREHPEKREGVLGLLGPDVLIDPEKVGAYSMENGGARFIIDRETKLVEATLIDRVSGDLAREFEQLVSIEFGGEAA
jgi:hypothetical protein